MLSYSQQLDCLMRGLRLVRGGSDLKGRAAIVLKERHENCPCRSIALTEVDGCMHRKGSLEEVGCLRRRKRQRVKVRCCRKKRNRVMRKR